MDSDEGGGERSRIMMLFVLLAEAIALAAARPIPEEPPVMRTVLFLRLENCEGSMFIVVILETFSPGLWLGEWRRIGGLRIDKTFVPKASR